MLKIYKSAIKLLENDDFGTISLVINSLHLLKSSVQNLPSHLFSEKICKLKDAFGNKMTKYKDQFSPL